MFRPDQPIKSHSEDLLGRCTFAKSLAKSILNYEQKDSISIGLFGEWGSGKTSIINMTMEEAEKLSNENELKPIIVKFNPWNFSDQNQLISYFFSELSSELGRTDHGEKHVKLGKTIQQYAGFFEPLSLVPFLSTIGEAAKAIKNAGAAAEKAGEAQSKNLSAIKQDLSKLLEELNRKIIIIIDDIDRLNNTEIRQIFQLVKSLADFPNTIYLLSFDKDVVINALKKVQEGAGKEYLEKVIQVPFEIPKLSKGEVERYLFAQLDEIIKDIPQDEWDSRYWGNIYHSGLKHFFNNLRHVNRYINTLKFNIGMVREEVNIVDFFAITALQVFTPKIYYGIRENKEMFSGPFNSSYSSEERTKKLYKEKCDEIISRVEVISKDNLLDFLKRLFPKLQSIYGNHGYGGGFLETWRKERKICSPDNFDVYFSLTIPFGSLSHQEINSVLQVIPDKDEFRTSLLNLNENGKISDFLIRIQDYTEKDIAKENINIIFEVLMDIGDLFPEGETGFYSFGNEVQIGRIFYQLSKRLISQEERFKILYQSIQDATNSLHTIVYEVSGHMDEHGEYKPDKKPISEEDRAISSEHLEALKTVTRLKIKEWADEDKLLTHRKFLSIIYLWKRIDDNSAVRDYVLNVIDTDRGLIDFIQSFLTQVHSHGIDDYVSTSNWKMDLDNIKDFIELDIMEPRVRKILNPDEFINLSDTEQIAVKKFINIFDGKKENRF